MARILSVGKDPGLLYSRNTVLQRTGAEVYSAKTEPAMALLAAQFFELVVLCHSLESEDIARICRHLGLFWPASRILTVEAFGPMPLEDPCRVEAIAWQQGPKALVDVVGQMLAAPEIRPATQARVIPINEGQAQRAAR